MKSINLGSGKSAYQSNGKYYIKSGDTRKEISADQYQKLLSNNSSSKSSEDSYDPESPQWNFEREIEDNFGQLDKSEVDELRDWWNNEADYYDKISELDQYEFSTELSNREKVKVLDKYFSKK